MCTCASSSSAAAAPAAAPEEQRGEPFFLTTPLYYVRLTSATFESRRLLCLLFAYSSQHADLYVHKMLGSRAECALLSPLASPQCAPSLTQVNAAPHMGSAYTTIAADVVARFQRLRGRRVTLVTGTDEHGEKIALAAAAKGQAPQQHCDGVVAAFQDLWRLARALLKHSIFSVLATAALQHPWRLAQAIQPQQVPVPCSALVSNCCNAAC